MENLKNENILKLILESFELYFVKQMLTILANKSIAQVVLKILDYAKIIRSYGRTKFILNEHTSKINCLALLSDNYIVSVSFDKTLKVWDINTNICIKTIEDDQPIYSVCVLPDNNILYYTTDRLRVLDSKINFKLIAGITLKESTYINKIILLPNNHLACSGLVNETSFYFFIINYKNFKLVKKINEHTSWINCMVNLTDSFASGSSDKTIKIWSMDYECLQTIIGHTGSVCALLYINDDNILISGSYDKTMRVWDCNNYNCMRVIETQIVRGFVTLPNGYFGSLACDSFGFWNVKDFQCIKTLKQNESPFLFIRLQDGRLAYTSNKLLIILNY
jgi:WD40 repeat protein